MAGVGERVEPLRHLDAHVNVFRVKHRAGVEVDRARGRVLGVDGFGAFPGAVGFPVKGVGDALFHAKLFAIRPLDRLTAAFEADVRNRWLREQMVALFSRK